MTLASLFYLALQAGIAILFRLVYELIVFGRRKPTVFTEGISWIQKILLFYLAIVITQYLANQLIGLFALLVAVALFFVGDIPIAKKINIRRAWFVLATFSYQLLSVFLPRAEITFDKAVLFPFGFMAYWGFYIGLTAIVQAIPLRGPIDTTKRIMLNLRTFVELVLVFLLILFAVWRTSYIIFWSQMIFLSLGLLGLGFITGRATVFPSFLFPRWNIATLLVSILLVLVATSLGYNTLTESETFWVIIVGFVYGALDLQVSKVAIATRSYRPVEVYNADLKIAEHLRELEVVLLQTPSENHRKLTLEFEKNRLIRELKTAPPPQEPENRLAVLNSVLERLKSMLSQATELRSEYLMETLRPTIGTIRNRIPTLVNQFTQNNINPEPLMTMKKQLEDLEKVIETSGADQTKGLAADFRDDLDNLVGSVVDFESALTNLIEQKARVQKLSESIDSIDKLGIKCDKELEVIKYAKAKLKQLESSAFESPSQCLAEIEGAMKEVGSKLQDGEGSLNETLANYTIKYTRLADLWVPRQIETTEPRNMLIVIHPTSTTGLGQIRVSTEILKTSSDQPIKLALPLVGKHYERVGLWGERGGRGRVLVEVQLGPDTEKIGPVSIKIPFSRTEWLQQTTTIFVLSAALFSLISIAAGVPIQLSAQIGSGLAAITVIVIYLARRLRR